MSGLAGRIEDLEMRERRPKREMDWLAQRYCTVYAGIYPQSEEEREKYRSDGRVVPAHLVASVKLGLRLVTTGPRLGLPIPR